MFRKKDKHGKLKKTERESGRSWSDGEEKAFRACEPGEFYRKRTTSEARTNRVRQPFAMRQVAEGSH